MRRTLARKNLLRRIALLLRNAQQQVLGGDVLVLEIVSFLERTLQQLAQSSRDRSLCGATGNLGQLLNLAINIIQDSLRTDSDLLEHGRNDAFAILDQRRQ